MGDELMPQDDATQRKRRDSIPQPAKATFWRIQGIRADQYELAVRWLKSQAQHGPPEVQNLQHFTLACDDSLRRTFCATLTTFGVAERPSLAHRDWRMDDTFIGLTPLHDPQDANVDFIAITGLGGHALGSFKDEHDGSTVWLRDFAPEDLPRARIITYGYDTRVIGSDSTQSIESLAQVFLDSVKVFRTATDTQTRPIVFLGHSLGGIVLKEALAQSWRIKQDDMGLYNVFLSTRGLVLMGVPNLGLEHLQFKTAVAGQPNAQFVAELLKRDGKPSSFLRRLAQDFSRLCKDWPSLQIKTFYETERSSTLEAKQDVTIALTSGEEALLIILRSQDQATFILQ